MHLENWKITKHRRSSAFQSVLNTIARAYLTKYGRRGWVTVNTVKRIHGPAENRVYIERRSNRVRVRVIVSIWSAAKFRRHTWTTKGTRTCILVGVSLKIQFVIRPTVVARDVSYTTSTFTSRLREMWFNRGKKGTPVPLSNSERTPCSAGFSFAVFTYFIPLYCPTWHSRSYDAKRNGNTRLPFLPPRRARNASRNYSRTDKISSTYLTFPSALARYRQRHALW